MLLVENFVLQSFSICFDPHLELFPHTINVQLSDNLLESTNFIMLHTLT